MNQEVTDTYSEDSEGLEVLYTEDNAETKEVTTLPLPDGWRFEEVQIKPGEENALNHGMVKLVIE